MKKYAVMVKIPVTKAVTFEAENDEEAEQIASYLLNIFEADFEKEAEQPGVIDLIDTPIEEVDDLEVGL